ncbi:MAG TPA: histidine kinase [Bryobacteraceae bacterium]|nr:histidine kinase [Bryobacteraceae bacterium]
MKSLDGNYLASDRRLALTLAVLIALILGGNGLLILQFERARTQTDRVTGVSHQLIAVLRLQESLLSFHQRLNELTQAKDLHRLLIEAQPLRAALLEQTRQTRNTLAYLPPDVRVDPAFTTALDAIETSMPAQLLDLLDLAGSGDWDAVRLRVDNEMKIIEGGTSTLVTSIDRDLDEELPRTIAHMQEVQRRVLLIVPATAISTVFVAAFFGWAIARRLWELRLEERVSERTRIGRELHDTLLQSFQGVLLKFHAVTFMLPDRPSDARRLLESAIEEARQAIAEGRDAVQGLRSSAVATEDLARAISTLGEGLSAADGERPSPDFRVHEEGTPRRLAPILRDEVYRIAGEALRNAFRHAAAKRIEVDIHYDKRQFRLRVRDDGKGIDRQVLEKGGRAGHHGLPGMYERAKLVGSKLAVWSQLDAGTEIELTIPAGIAYARTSGQHIPSGKEI